MTYEEFKNQYPIRLNPQQEEAVRQTEGPVLLLAVPGSGKTTLLVTRLGYMLHCKNIRPERVLTVTYTIAATRDMKARFISFFGEDHADKLTFRTINGLCAVVIGTYARQKGTEPFGLLDDERQIKSVLRDLLARTGTAFPSDQQVSDARTHITYCKNMMLTEAEIHAHKVDGMDFPRVYFEYQDYLLRSRRMDYDDQMVFTYRIFRQYPDILAYFQHRWPYICVDEAQDTSKIQHAILRLLASGSGNIFMVGDEDQSIYGFRAAWPQALLEFEKVFPGAKILKLETNYRSTRAIVEKADAFIRRNQNRRPKSMHTENQQGSPIRKIMLADYNRQYSYLLKIAEGCTESTAVLYRNNDSALPLIDLLEQKGVPYACRQREGFFFTSPIVRDITDMLEFAFDDGNKELFLRFYYKLDLKLKKAVVTRLLYGMPKDKSVFEVLLESGELESWQIGKVKAMQTHYHYTLVDLLQQELPEHESRQHTETVTLESKNKDMASVLALLPQEKEFITDDGLAGTLTLRLDTVQVEVAGYQSSPTHAAASEFITRAIEDYGAPAEAQRSGFGGKRRSSEMSELSPQGGSEGYGACDDADQIAKRENYVSYIAQRPRAERLGAHGLFNGTGDALELSRIAEEVANHPGNVWLPIISMRREDAARLGYDNARQWQALLSTYAPQIADAMKIPWEQFRWYASYHDEGAHPHVHMVCYSADGRSGFLDKEGIARIKSGLAKNIFRQELTEIYRQQTQRRDDLVRQSGEVMKELIRQMLSGTLENPRIEQLMGELAQRLKSTSGKKQYGYLKAPLKAVVDEIVDELAKDSRVSSAYDLWYQLREEVLRTYQDDLPDRLPLSRQTEFKRIKNVAVEEAARLGEHTEVFTPADTQELSQAGGDIGPEPEVESEGSDVPEEASEAPPAVVWSDRYKRARSFLYGDDDTPQDHEQACRLFMEEALGGNALAMHDLGRLLAVGTGVEAGAEQSHAGYAKALSAFQAVERQRPNRYVEYRIGKMYAGGLGTEQDDTAAAKWFSQAAARGYQYAQYALAGLYSRGKGVPQDDGKALELYTLAAAQGFPYAAWELGKRYRDGIGCATDGRQAARYFSAAYDGFRTLADQRPDDRLQYRIGWMLLHGVGTERDKTAALEWLEKSAELKNPYAEYQIAKHILTDPSAKPEQTRQAVGWLTHAAEAGLDCAQYTRSKLYLLRKEVPQDRESAVRWFTLAAEQGNEYARYFLDHMDDSPSLFASATRLLHHMGRIFQEQAPPPSGGISFVDSKLRRKIREKKITMGHKPDDHEKQGIALK